MNTDKIFAEAIANEYSVKNTSKVVALKKLDRRAKLPANISAYSIGIVSTLVFGTGMCLAMAVIGSGGLWHMVLGIALGVIGLAGVSVNYFVYKKLLERGKQKYAGDIIQLASEISRA